MPSARRRRRPGRPRSPCAVCCTGAPSRGWLSELPGCTVRVILTWFTSISAGEWRQNREASDEILAQHLGATGVAELGERLGLDLADPFPGNAELPTDLFQRPRMAVGQAEPHLDNPPLPHAQYVQDLVQLVLQHYESGSFHRHDRVGVFAEVAEIGVLLADRRLE